MKDITKTYFKKLKCIIIQSPIEVLDDDLCESVFYKLIKLKVDGFNIIGSKYLAIDQNDFLGTHIVLCEEVEDELRVLMSFKIMSEDLALHWNIPFSGRDVVKKSESELHIIAVEDYIKRCQDKGRKIAYPGSMTMCPSIKDPSERTEIIKIFQALLTFYHKEIYPSVSICVARDRVRSEFFLREMGFSELSFGGQVVPPVLLPQYRNEPFKIMVVEDYFSLHALRMMKTYEELIYNTVEIFRDSGTVKKKQVLQSDLSKSSA
ncbi:MAG: hypothetical protein ACOVP4_00360 [Bacteriovoracaceae bacterium]